MSRAFVKEPEAQDPRCPMPPGCGGHGEPVAKETVLAHLRPGVAATLAASAFYCPNPKCPVGYFDSWGGVVLADDLRAVPYPKDPGAVLCCCLGIRPAEIEDEAKAGAPKRIREILACAASPAARCQELMPNARSCAELARKLFLRAAGRS